MELVNNDSSVTDEVVLAGNERDNVIKDVDLSDAIDDVDVAQVTGVSVWWGVFGGTVDFIVAPFEMSSCVAARVAGGGIGVNVESVETIVEVGGGGDGSSNAN